MAQKESDVNADVELEIDDELNEGEEEQLSESEVEIDDSESEGEDEKVTLSKEEFSALSSRTKTDEQIAKVLEKLASKDDEANKQQPVGDPFAIPINSEDDLNDDEFETQLFERGKSKQAIQKLVDKYVSPKLTKLQARTLSAELRAELSENEDVKPYADEVKRALSNLPPEQRVQDGIVQAAIAHVRKQHESEITQKRIDEAVQAKLAELGVSSQANPAKPASDHSEDLGDSGTARAPKKRKIRMTSAQRAEAEQRARALGMSFSDYVNNVWGG